MKEIVIDNIKYLFDKQYITQIFKKISIVKYVKKKLLFLKNWKNCVIYCLSNRYLMLSITISFIRLNSYFRRVVVLNLFFNFSNTFLSIIAQFSNFFEVFFWLQGTVALTNTHPLLSLLCGGFGGWVCVSALFCDLFLSFFFFYTSNWAI